MPCRFILQNGTPFITFGFTVSFCCGNGTLFITILSLCHFIVQNRTPVIIEDFTVPFHRGKQDTFYYDWFLCVLFLRETGHCLWLLSLLCLHVYVTMLITIVSLWRFIIEIGTSFITFDFTVSFFLETGIPFITIDPTVPFYCGKRDTA